MWEEVMEKTVDAESKASLQPLSGIREIDSRCSKSYRLSSKKEKDEVSREHRDEDKDKVKSHNPLSTNTS